MEETNILDVLTRYLGNTRLNSTAWCNEEYAGAEREAARCADQLELYMGEEARLLFHEYTRAASAANEIYAEAAYQQGMKDLAEFVASLVDVKALLAEAEKT